VTQNFIKMYSAEFLMHQIPSRDTAEWNLKAANS